MGLLDTLRYFTHGEKFSQGHGVALKGGRAWEESYRERWRHDKVVRSTHGVNCTGSCSWRVFVKNGLVTWELQATDYPRTRPDLPDHEPRGCPRGASYSWYLYSAHRVRYPMVRGVLLRLWRQAKQQHPDPVEAWASIVEDSVKATSYKSARGKGGFVRAQWDEMEELVAAANIYTIRRYGPDRVVGFSPIPAMSMVSYAAGARYLSLLGGVCMSFYDWYCDLPVASPQTWGEQTDVPESADWFNSSYIICWGSNVPMTRTPDAHFLTEARYRGAKTVGITPDYSEVARLTDQWLAPRQGTDAALAMAMVHVVLREFHLNATPSDYFRNYVKANTDLPFLVILEEKNGRTLPGRMLRASDLAGAGGETNNPEWKTLVFDAATGDLAVPTGSIGFRWGEAGKWNISGRAANGSELDPVLTLLTEGSEIAKVAFPYYAGTGLGELFAAKPGPDVLVRGVPCRRIAGTAGELRVATIFDVMAAHYSIDRGIGGDLMADANSVDAPYTPVWQEAITGVPAAVVERIGREFADNAHRSHGRSMVIIGASVNHWFHSDMGYRSIISLLMLCGTPGVSGGGWAHYVGQEKLRPQSGWAPVAFALDWTRPPRQQNSTSFWYLHTDQWRYERLGVSELLSPLHDGAGIGKTLLDCNVQADRMGWLPSNPQLNRNPLELCREARAAGQEPAAFALEALKARTVRMASEDPDHPDNFPRNLFVWRANLLGSSSKGHEYFLKHLLGTHNGVSMPELDEASGMRPEEVEWRDAPEGKLDLLVTLDFRMSTTCMNSDVVLPTATWYEKNDINTSDMHPFIHPLSRAVDPGWQARSDWKIFVGLAKKFSELCPNHLGVEEDLVLAPIMHDTAGELAQPLDARDWKKGECEAKPGKTMPNLVSVQRNYPATYTRMTSVGPLLGKLGNGGKGLSWNTEAELTALIAEHGTTEGQPTMETDLQAIETILRLAPETNGAVAVKAWESLGKATGRDHRHLALHREDERIRFLDMQAQPRKIISSPIWSGVESEKVCYTANYTNVNERIPWRTLTGRQQFYQDHAWMRAFGENLPLYRPPVDMKALSQHVQDKDGGPWITLNFLTPHQKWGIHSTYTDNLLMLTLGRGGPVLWISETDAKRAAIADNDWVEVVNGNGALVARAIVSQRIPAGAIFMYHAQEKTISTPLSASNGERGIHNSVSRISPKPTHMIGGYAQQSYGFNYIGTIGTNRDEFVQVRRMDRVEWGE
jgi:nitrate reductase alpha subunit